MWINGAPVGFFAPLDNRRHRQDHAQEDLKDWPRMHAGVKRSTAERGQRQ